MLGLSSDPQFGEADQMDRVSVIWPLALALAAGACASTGARPRPFPVPGGETGRVKPPVVNDEARVDGYAVVGTALALRGAPYRNGGSNPDGFDCSGFTQYVFARYGIALPRDVRAQYQIGKTVEPADLAPGDLVFFVTTDPDVSHVAIVVGGDEFVHAPSSSGVVRVEHLSARYWSERYAGARRVLR
jgi:cell wall-associated NlpC family hydrolase